MKIETYVLAMQEEVGGKMRIAPSGDRAADMPMCFSSDYALHLFDFSESRVRCEAGDRLFLLKGDVDISQIDTKDDFPVAFKTLLANEEGLDHWLVIRQKEAVNVKSKEYKKRVMDDLKHTTEQIKVNRLLM